MKRALRGLCWTVCALALASTVSPAFAFERVRPTAPQSVGWPLWNAFADGFILDEGRVVDWSERSRTVSEGQAYAMFFSLVANDRKTFDRLYEWTQKNLSGGRFTQQLPAWLWGYPVEGPAVPMVLDPNSASDADLWFAYNLIEAGRLWNVPRYTQDGHALLNLIAKVETREKFGTTVLLPGKNGFEFENAVRLNPSYLPPFVLRRLAQADPKGPWLKILQDFTKLLPDLVINGGIPDWFLLTEKGPRQDSVTGDVGSYDSVRNYLWAGLMNQRAPEAAAFMRAYKPFVSYVRQSGRIPEKWYSGGRAGFGSFPVGIQTAFIPFFALSNGSDLAKGITADLSAKTASNLVGTPARYYEQVLSLFALGWVDHQFSFDENGKLIPKWKR
ncbi:MAG: cellulose synthase complex periplasmic endoglucanase BcsZ [Pseudomonadota bacterium]